MIDFKRQLGAIIILGLLAVGRLGFVSARAGDQYFLLNTSATANTADVSSPSNVLAYVQQKFGAANAASDLKVGVAVIYTPGNTSSSTPETLVQQTLALMTNDLAIAQRLNVPFLVQVDTENWLPTALLNWYDPAKAGFDTNKTADVEWTGWDRTNAVKLCWRNWGTQLRVGPQPNLLSTNFQAWEKSIYTNFIPPVLQWYNSLNATQKCLFVGWKCGWETSLNGQYYYYSNGNSYYSLPAAGDPAWNSPKQTLGYNAARTAGFKTNGVLDFSGGSANDYDINMKIIGRHLTYLSSLAFSNGIPRGKIFNHSIAEGVDRYNTDKLVNPYSNPGVTGTGVMKNNASLMEAVHTVEALYGGTGYCYGEFPFSSTNYSDWFNYLTNSLAADPDCVFQSLYNYNSMKGVTNAERAMLDVMALNPNTYDLVYQGNANSGGIPPAASAYAPGATVTVSGKGSLIKAGYTFAGWNTASNGSGTAYAASNSFPIVGDTTLYAQWTRVSITSKVSGTKLVLDWPAGQGWQVQAQTNNLTTGLGTNWFPIATAAPPYTNTINPTNRTVFYRLSQTTSNYVIYSDSLPSGWFMNGWSYTGNPSNPSPVRSGTNSLALTVLANGGAGPYFSGSLSTTNYNYLSFWIHGGSTGGQALSLTPLRSGAQAASWYIPSVPANTWVNYVLPLDLLGLANVPDFNGLRFLNNLTGSDAPVFYVDDIQLQP